MEKQSQYDLEAENKRKKFFFSILIDKSQYMYFYIR